MAQTTGAMSFVDAMIEISTNGTAWTDVSGFANMVEVSGGDRAIAEFFTADGDTPIITAGKRSAWKIKCKIAYTEATADPFTTVLTQHQTAGGGRLDVRFSPGGGDAGDLRFASGAGKIESLVPPQGEVAPGDAIPIEFTIVTSEITKSAVP